MNVKRPMSAVESHTKHSWSWAVAGFLTSVAGFSFWFYRIATAPVSPDVDDSSSPGGEVFGTMFAIPVLGVIGVFGAVAGELLSIIISKFLPRSRSDLDA